MSDYHPHEQMDAALATLRAGGPSIRTVSCPQETQWFEVAGGTVPDELSATLLQHAAECFYCAQLLKEALHVFSDESHPGEDEVVLSERFAEVVAREERRKRKSIDPRWWLPIAAIIVLTAGLAAWRFALPRYAEQHAATLMAQAETGTRFSSFRFSGAPYAPRRVTRSQAAEIPVSVLDAAWWIRWASEGSETSVLRARIALASGDTAQVPERIQQVLNQRGPTPELLNDLAAAWAARAERNRDDMSAERALQAVDQALAISPSFPEALFNRALILNLLNRPEQACAALAAFRAADKDPRWSDDATARLFCGK
jgi:tetratricopeptide (TPR) repeat protein